MCYRCIVVDLFHALDKLRRSVDFELNPQNAGELYLVIHASAHAAAVNSYKLAISEELEPAKKAALPFLWFFVVHKLSKIYMWSDRQQSLEKCLPAVVLRFYDVFLIVTAAR